MSNKDLSRLKRAVEALDILNTATWSAHKKLQRLVELQGIDVHSHLCTVTADEHGNADPEQAAETINQAIARIYEAVQACACSVDYAGERIKDYVDELAHFEKLAAEQHKLAMKALDWNEFDAFSRHSRNVGKAQQELDRLRLNANA